MSQKIYTSPIPPVPIVNRSVFTHLFSSGDRDTIGGYPSSTPAFIDAPTGATITRAQLKQLALAFGYGLRSHTQTRLDRGDVVLMHSPNSLAWPVVIFGSVAAGLRCTLANSAYNARELAFQCSNSGAKLVFTTEEGLPTVREMFKDLGLSKEVADSKIVILGQDLQWAGGPSASSKPEAAGLLRMEDFLVLGSLKEEEKFEGPHANETVYLCYSSGTTGKPKGVETTHKNITSILDVVRPAFPPFSYPAGDSMLGLLPFYHVYGAVKLLHFPFACGFPVVVMARFDPVQFCANVERYKITTSLIVPPVLVVLSRHPAVDQHDLSTLKVLCSGAAPLGAALCKQVMDRLSARRKPGTGEVSIIQGYGLTETSPTTHLLPAAEAQRKVGSIGILLPNLEARLLADGDVDADEGQHGEIWVRGPTIMKGYLNNSTATEESITQDGWFKTGDIAIRDAEGFYYIVDRRKELIKYKGFQVPPAELESVLLTHPDIADTAVIGIDSAKEATELPRAYVVHANPESLKTEGDKIKFAKSVQQWIQSKVARHKLLRGGVVVIDVIPKSAAGKILRRELRERAKHDLGGKDPADDIVRVKL